jgi:hypothetical protein
MTEPNTITITTDGISEEQKTTEKFKTAYAAMLAKLTAPGFIPVLCVHEAAHLIYFSVMGVEKFNIFPARLEFDPAINDYKGHLPAIQALNIPDWAPGDFWNWLFKIARALAAGGVASRKLMPSSDGGDRDDKERFEIACAQYNQDPQLKTKIDSKEMWAEAQLQVAKDLENPKNMDALNQEAAKLRQHFGL